MEESCMICGGYGPEDPAEVSCKKCGASRKRFAAVLQEEETTKSMIERSRRKRVPEFYSENLWTQAKFQSSNSYRMNDNLKEFGERLDSLLQIYKRGSLPNNSGFFCAPTTYSKLTWAFSCMKHAEDAGYTVAPLLDTVEAHRLVVLSGMKSLDYTIDNVTVDEYINSDVLFLTVSKTGYRKNASTVIREILDRRSRRGLVTMIISEFSLEEISVWDDTQMFKRTIGVYEGENRKKSLTTLIYREVFGD